MNDKNFQLALLNEFREFVRPILETEGDLVQILGFLEHAGWDLRSELGDSTEDLVSGVSEVISMADALIGLVESPPTDFLSLKKALDQTGEIVVRLKEFPDKVFTTSEIDLSELPGDLIKYLGVLYVFRRSQFAFRLLELLTIVRQGPREYMLRDNRIVRERNRAPCMEFDRLPEFLQDSVRTIRKEYWPSGFGDQETINEGANAFFTRVQRVLAATNRGDIRYGNGRAIALIGRGSGVEELSREEELVLDGMMSIGWKTFLAEQNDQTEFGFSIGLMPDDGERPGVFVVPYGRFAIDGLTGSWHLKLESDISLDGFEITRSGVSSYGSENRGAHVGILARPISNDGTMLMVGASDGTRCELGDAWIQGDFSFWDDAVEVAGIVGVNRGALVIDAGDGDSFLKQLLPPGGARVEFDFSLGWSNVNGFHIEGSGGLDVTIPTHVDVGVAELTAVTVKLLFQGDELPMEVGGDVQGNFGPLKVALEDVGLRFNLAFPDDGGNLGLVHLTPGFKAPAGAGLSIDATGIAGGGFLSFDDVNKRYAGIVQLTAGDLELVGIGLITTRMPDGSDGFSLLINIGVEFTPPIQLPYGFTLSGVGGLIALNRTMEVDVLRSGLRAGTLNSILFPEDPIANAARLISDLRSVFPPANDRFIVGPMIKLGWGSPRIVEADIGIFIELPEPVRIALLGQISVALPQEDNALIELHIDVLGVIDFEAETLSIDATLYDSRMLQYALSGDAAVRFSWGDSPALALSMGGFHPRFSPPPAFPALRRMTMDMSRGRNLQLYCNGYQAITANTVQFGASVVLLARKRGATLEGTLSFDTLIYLSPFAFVGDISGNVAARYRGHRLASVLLRMQLSGPTPWNARGRAEFGVLCWDVTVRFNETWGRTERLEIAPIDPWPLLKDALERDESWGARLPSGVTVVETLASQKSEENLGAEATGEGSGQASAPEVLLVHPMGSLDVRQNVLPLEIKLQKVGSAPLEKPASFSIDRVTLVSGDAGGSNVGTSDEKQGDVEVVADVEEDFARAQFVYLSDSERLTLPSFEKMKAGVALGGDRVAFGSAVPSMGGEYETVLIRDDRTSSEIELGGEAASVEPPTAAELLRSELAASAAARCPLHKSGRHKYAVAEKRKALKLLNERFQVVNSDTGEAESMPEVKKEMGRLQTEQAMADYLETRPDLAGRLRVTPMGGLAK